MNRKEYKDAIDDLAFKFSRDVMRLEDQLDNPEDDNFQIDMKSTDGRIYRITYKHIVPERYKEEK